MQPRNLHNAALALATLASTCLGAGWSDVWPSEEHPRETVRQLSECYTSVFERVDGDIVDGSGYAPTWWRSNKANLSRVKGGLKAALQYHMWVRTNSVSTPSTAVAWLNADAARIDWNWYGKGGNVSAGATALCAEVQIPTNYFDYTPWRFVTGLGAFTNDASTPYPHGYTNASTVAGGTQFPAGRSCWYTTDYGWNQFPKLIAKLLYIGDEATALQTNMFQGNGFNYTNWPAAKASAESSYAGTGSCGTFFGTWGLSDNSYGGYFYAYIFMSRFLMYADAWDQYLGVTGFTEYFYCPQKMPNPGMTTEFDDHGIGLTEGSYAYVANDQTNAWGGCRSAPWGSTNIPATWCIQPTYTNGPYRGFQQSTTRPPLRLRRFNIPGGFTFY